MNKPLERGYLGALPLRLADTQRAWLSFHYRHFRVGQSAEAKAIVRAWLNRRHVTKAAHLDPAGIEEFIWFLDHTEPRRK